MNPHAYGTWQVEFSEHKDRWEALHPETGRTRHSKSLASLRDAIDSADEEVKKFKPFSVLVVQHYGNGWSEGTVTSLEEDKQRARVTLANGERKVFQVSCLYQDTPENRDKLAAITGMEKQMDDLHQRKIDLRIKLTPCKLS